MVVQTVDNIDITNLVMCGYSLITCYYVYKKVSG